MTSPQPTPPKGTSHGTLRWFVHRKYATNARLGERRGQLVWGVTPIILGRGSEGVAQGVFTRCANRDSALAYAHRQAERTYRHRKARP